MYTDQCYSRLLTDLVTSGERIKTRNDWVRRLPPYINAAYTFHHTPLVCSRKVAWKNCLREWEWFMSGTTKVDSLHESVRDWWKPWENEKGHVAYGYGKQLRDFEGDNASADQVSLLIEGIIAHPFSRRNVATTWHPVDMLREDCAITNCHGTVIQAFVDAQGALHLKTYQRSVDVVCGLPHNWLQYWGFLMYLCRHTDKKVGSLTWVGGDVHLYEEHVELAKRIVEVSFKVRGQPELAYEATTPRFKADDFALDQEYNPVFTERVKMIV